MDGVARHGRRLLNGRAALAAPPFLVFALLLAWGLTHPPGLTGDTVALVKGARQIATCLEQGVRSNCDFANGMPEGAVAPYPLLQYAPAFVLTQLGSSDPDVYRALSVLNLLAVGVLLALAGWTAAATGHRWAAPLVLATLVASPLLWYANATFAEPLAAMLLLLLVVGALRRWPPAALALLALLAAVTKETAFPFTLGLALLCAWRTPLAVPALRRAHVVALTGGTAAAVLLAAAFNWFRYRQVTNFTYGHEYFRVPGVGQKVEFSTAIWVAPNGGVLWFWPLATLVLLAAIVAALLRRSHGRRVGDTALAATGLLAILLLQTGVLGSWWAPFGWVAWGPRLMLPLLPAAVLTAVVLLGEPLGAALRRLPVAGWAIAAVVFALLALPNALVISDPPAVSNLFSPDDECPTIPNILPDRDYYYGCIEHYAYERRLVLLDALDGSHADWGALLGGGVSVSALTLLLVTGRRRSAAQPSSATIA